MLFYIDFYAEELVGPKITDTRDKILRSIILDFPGPREARRAANSLRQVVQNETDDNIDVEVLFALTPFETFVKRLQDAGSALLKSAEDYNARFGSVRAEESDDDGS